MSKPVVHWEIVGKDGRKLQQFYAGLFDWKVDANNPFDYGMVDPGGARGIPGGIGPSQDGPAVRIYIQVDDLQAYLDRAERLGGKTLMPPTEIPGMVTLAMFQDPEGNQVGLVKG